MPMPARILSTVIGALALLLCVTASAVAETYTVTRTDDPIPGACEPGDCSLREALMTANGTTAVDDVVVVPASATPYLIQYEELSLSITDEVEVRGGGADKTIVKGDGKEVVFTISAKSTLSGLTITGGKGGIQNGGDLTLRGVSVEGNEREGAGGGIQSNGPLTIESSFLGSNKTPGISGGAIQANSDMTIIDSTIAGNSSMAASAINGNGAVLIANSAVVANRSGGTGTAAVRGSPLTVSNSIFFDNRNSEGLVGCTSFPALTSLGGNVSDEATCGAGPGDRPSVNPLLGTLALHGGTTPLYDLLPGSPAIDFATGCPSLDQRGVARPQGAACDSGPYEFVPPPLPIAVGGDKDLFMRLGKGKLKMNRKGRIRIRLTCPATEASPPCRGQVAVMSRRGWPVQSCDCPRLLIAYKAQRRFSIPAGKTQSVVARLPRGAGRILKRWKPRKVILVVTAEDAAGNRWGIKQFRKLVPR